MKDNSFMTNEMIEQIKQVMIDVCSNVARTVNNKMIKSR